MNVVEQLEEMVGGLLEVQGRLPHDVPLLELGADSLVLIEISDRVQKELGVEISVVQLFEDIVTIEGIARWIEQQRGVDEEVAILPVGEFAADTSEAAAVPRDYASATAESRRLSEMYQDIVCNNRRYAERDRSERDSSYPIWVERSEGPYLWDADGTRLIDLAMGYGSHLFGHNPDFVMRALREQLDQGIHLGGEVVQTGELARKIVELTGAERVNFCVTGTEAVFTAMRLARAFTGRGKVLILQHAYHGHSDATLYGVKPGHKNLRAAVPNAAGVSAAGADDVLVASSDDPQLAEFISEHGADIAAVLMEPIQNQEPERDRSQLAAEMRKVTESVGALLIFDEVLTGFRFAPGGFQELYGVDADLVTYGKTVGAGLPVSVVAGRADVMDLVDGGPWTGDLRVSSGRLTYTAGTYTKHPLAMAGANAVLGELVRRGPQFQQQLSERGDRFRRRIDAVLRDADVGVRVVGRGSLLRFLQVGNSSFGFVGRDFHAFRRALVEMGVYITEVGISYISDAHTDDVLDETVQAVAGAARTVAARRAQTRPAGSGKPVRAADRKLAVSLSFFGMQDDAHGGDFYDDVVRLAETAEAGGLEAIWLPERHFDRFAGFSPNPAILAALIASRTSRIGLRAGSVVLPLHSALTVAEDWAMLDVASKGRIGVAGASGWMKRDFILSESPFEDRRKIFSRRISEIERLWRGEKVAVTGPDGAEAEVMLYPRPVQDRLPMWQAVLGNEGSFYEAGLGGRNILTNLIQQDLGELRSKIARYRAGRKDAGLDPHGGEITVLVHTAYTQDDAMRADARRDLEAYMLQTFKSMLQTFKSSHPTPASVTDEAWSGRMAQAAQRLLNGLSLIGNQREWLEQCAALKDAGATEISCLVDFVAEPERWTATVNALIDLHKTVNALPAPPQNAAATGFRTVELTSGAIEIWAASKLSPQARAAYTIQRMFEARGQADVGRLREAFLQVLRADASLRLTVLPTGEAGAIQDYCEDHHRAFILYEGIAPDSEAFYQRVARDLADQPLDAEHAPALMMRCQRSAGGLLIHLAASHAVMDGTQFSDVLEKVGKAYAGKRIDESAVSQAAPAEDTSADRSYWQTAIEGIPQEILERARVRSVTKEDWRGRRFSRPLPAGWVADAESRARENRTTPFIETLACVMRCLDGQAGRRLLYAFPALRPCGSQFGSRANLLPLWADGPETGLRRHCQNAVLNGLQHGSLTFTQIFSGTGDRQGTGHVIPDVTFSWDRFESLALGAASIRELPTSTDVVRFPLGVTVTVGPDGEAALSLDVAESADVDGEACIEALYTVLSGSEPSQPAVPAAEALEALAAHACSGTRADGLQTVWLDGREVLSSLIIGRARATTAAVRARCDVDQISVVRIALQSTHDLLVAALACMMLGIADRATPAAASPGPDSPALEFRPSATGAESTAMNIIVGISAWTYVPPESELPGPPSGRRAVEHLLATLAAEHPATVQNGLAEAALAMAGHLQPNESPRPRLDEAVRVAWERVLGHGDFGDDIDFFEIGGDSIAAIRVVADLNTRFGVSCPVTLVYEHPTISELATAMLASL